MKEHRSGARIVLWLPQLTDSVSSLGNWDNYVQFYIPPLFPDIWEWENLQMVHSLMPNTALHAPVLANFGPAASCTADQYILKRNSLLIETPLNLSNHPKGST